MMSTDSVDGAQSCPGNGSASEDRTGNSSQQTEHDILLAATLIQDAAASRNMDFKSDEHSVRSYILFKHVGFKVMLYICLWGNILLTLFETPAVKVAPFWATMACEGMFMTFLAVRLAHAAHFQDRNVFWRDPKNILVLLIVVLTVADVVCYSVWVTVFPVSVAQKAVRWSRPLRPLLLVNLPEGRQLRKAFRNIRRTLPDILHVLILFFASIALFALLALKLFKNRDLTYPSGAPYFQNYWDGFWDLYVLVTTANNPDVKMPSYNQSAWFALFFMIYLMVNLYVFMNIVLAVIYNNYRKHLKNEVKATVQLKRELLSRAFDILASCRNAAEVVTKETWHVVMATVAPKKSPVQRDLLLSVLDIRGNDIIEKKEFLKLADLMNIELTVTKQRGTVFDRCCPPCYGSKYSEMVKSAILTRYFQGAFDILILANAVCIGLGVEVAEWFFLAMFTVEIILKMYALGPKKYFNSFWNNFDFAVIGAAWIVTVGISAAGQSGRFLVLDMLMVLRILRLIRLAAAFQRFKVVLVTIVNIGPSIATYTAVIFVVFYIYAVVGMEIFHGRIHGYHGYNSTNQISLYCGNPALNASEFAAKKYCNNNFNDVIHAMFLLFDLLVVNQWHVLAEGHVLVTHKAARVFFMSFHAVCVIILLNIFTAFVLEAFILEYTLSKGRLESIMETRIKQMGLGVGQQRPANLHKKSDRQDLTENMEQESSADGTSGEPRQPDNNNTADDGDLRFRLKKHRSKRLETLLQLMFESELGEESVTSGDSHRPSVTLENVL